MASKSKPLSKRSVICAICENTCANRKNLEIHFDRCHPNEKCLAKGQTQLTFISPKDKKRKLTCDDPFERESPEDDKTIEIEPCSDITCSTLKPDLYTSDTSLPCSSSSMNSVEQTNASSTSEVLSQQDVLSQMQNLLDRLKLETSSDKLPPFQPDRIRTDFNQMMILKEG